VGQLPDAVGRYRLQHQWREGADELERPLCTRSSRRVIIPSLKNTEGYWALLSAAHLETGKPYKEAQYEVDAGFKKLTTLKPNLLNVYTDAPQAINLLEQGEAQMIGGQFSAYTLIRKAAGSPVALAIPSDGGFAMPSGITKVKNGPAGDIADAIVNMFLGPDVQSVLATKAFVVPTNPETPKPAGYPDPSQLFAEARSQVRAPASSAEKPHPPKGPARRESQRVRSQCRLGFRR
jgi:ABC-type Fe3+ transport system substrate-binding protein